MPNEYYYFESDEVSIDRLQLEIELLKQLQESNLLLGIEWKQYDTKALKLFVKNGIKEAHDELKLRQIDNPAELRRKYEDLDFVRRCIQRRCEHISATQRHSTKTSLLTSIQILSPILVNQAFVLACLIFIGR